MSKSKAAQRGEARVQLPVRNQMAFRMMSLDQMVPENHLVRVVVRFVDALDLSELYEQIKATSGQSGRTPIDPRILFALWLFATLEGETSGRRIARLTERDVVYMYLCGEVSVNYHTVCDFRTAHGDLLERILTDSIAVLAHHGLIRLETVAQDGMRVRASAGTSSFRRAGSLDEAREQAAAYLDDLQRQEEDDDDPAGPRRRSARQRAAREKLDRLRAACTQMDDLQKRYEERNQHKSPEQHRSPPRASTTDPDARRMKMADGGFRPAYNVQFASDADSLVIISADVTNEGSDAALLEPMYDRVCRQYQQPAHYLADGGFSKKAAVTALESRGTKFYGPLPREQKELAAGRDPYAARPGENQWYTAFRERMGTDAARERYRRRAAAAELPHANCRNQGLGQFRVRGRLKVKAQTLWHALAYNFRRFCCLRDEANDQAYLEVLMAR